MRFTRNIAPLALVVAAVATPAAAAPAADAALLREFEGTVVSVNRDARTFRLREGERRTVRIRVTRRTRFERIAGFRALVSGMRNVEATVRRVDGRWVARSVERSGATAMMTDPAVFAVWPRAPAGTAWRDLRACGGASVYCGW